MNFTKIIMGVAVMSLLVGCSPAQEIAGERQADDLTAQAESSVQGEIATSDNQEEMISEKPEESKMNHTVDVEFVTIENGEETYEISMYEITNAHYIEFLNSAYKDGLIQYDAKKGEVFTLDGYSMIQLSGSRVVKDHNKDGIYSLDEMENPLNRCYIQYDEELDAFTLVDPEEVDWNQYFDSTLYPNVVDSIVDWPELNGGEGSFYGNADADKQLPTLEEIKKWPVTFIRYYGAKEFADYYGYDLPTREQWIFAAQGGQDFKYATNDGELHDTSAWFNADGPGLIHKGHAQAYDSLDPNPYGIYQMGGNVWEWTKEWAEWTANEHHGTVDRFFIDEDMRSPIIDESQEMTVENQYKKSLIGGSFNYFDRTMSVEWTTTAFIHAGNDHFGFRVVKNS